MDTSNSQSCNSETAAPISTDAATKPVPNNNGRQKANVKKQVVYQTCEVCNCELAGQAVIDAHMAGSKHAKRLKAQEQMSNALNSKGDVPFRCETCDVTVNSHAQLEGHYAGSKHKLKVAAKKGDKTNIAGKSGGTVSVPSSLTSAESKFYVEKEDDKIIIAGESDDCIVALGATSAAPSTLVVPATALPGTLAAPSTPIVPVVAHGASLAASSSPIVPAAALCATLTTPSTPLVPATAFGATQAAPATPTAPTALGAMPTASSTPVKPATALGAAPVALSTPVVPTPVNGKPNGLRCVICSLTVNSPLQLEQHLGSKKHKERESGCKKRTSTPYSRPSPRGSRGGLGSRTVVSEGRGKSTVSSKFTSLSNSFKSAGYSNTFIKPEGGVTMPKNPFSNNGNNAPQHPTNQSPNPRPPPRNKGGFGSLSPYVNSDNQFGMNARGSCNSHGGFNRGNWHASNESYGPQGSYAGYGNYGYDYNAYENYGGYDDYSMMHAGAGPSSY